jgi:hypothetical protein
MPSVFSFLLSLGCALMGLCSVAFADCERCRSIPELCKDIVNCARNCQVTQVQARLCLDGKHIDSAKYAQVTGGQPPPGAEPGRPSGSSPAKPPKVSEGAAQVSGRLPREVIERIVRQNFGRFRLCYENGLRNNPKLQGRVSVRFVIGRNGIVSNVSNGSSTLPDGGVVSCVVRAFYGLSFAQPEGGIVTVTYPIMFAPGG